MTSAIKISHPGLWGAAISRIVDDVVCLDDDADMSAIEDLVGHGYAAISLVSQVMGYSESHEVASVDATSRTIELVSAPTRLGAFSAASMSQVTFNQCGEPRGLGAVNYFSGSSLTKMIKSMTDGGSALCVAGPSGSYAKFNINLSVGQCYYVCAEIKPISGSCGIRTTGTNSSFSKALTIDAVGEWHFIIGSFVATGTGQDGIELFFSSAGSEVFVKNITVMRNLCDAGACESTSGIDAGTGALATSASPRTGTYCVQYTGAGTCRFSGDSVGGGYYTASAFIRAASGKRYKVAIYDGDTQIYCSDFISDASWRPFAHTAKISGVARLGVILESGHSCYVDDVVFCALVAEGANLSGVASVAPFATGRYNVVDAVTLEIVFSDFEDSVSGWSANDVSIAQSSANKNGGDYSLLVSATGASPYAYCDEMVTPFAEYAVSGWVAGDAGYYGEVIVEGAESGNVYYTSGALYGISTESAPLIYILSRDGVNRYVCLNSTFDGLVVSATKPTFAAGEADPTPADYFCIERHGTTGYIYLNSSKDGLRTSLTKPSFSSATIPPTIVMIERSEAVRAIELVSSFDGFRVSSIGGGFEEFYGSFFVQNDTSLRVKLVTNGAAYFDDILLERRPLSRLCYRAAGSSLKYYNPARWDHGAIFAEFVLDQSDGTSDDRFVFAIDSFLRLIVSSGDLVAQVYVSGAWIDQAIVASIAQDEWHMVCVSWDSLAGFDFYLDDQKLFTYSATWSEPDPWPKYMFIGCDQDGSCGMFGRIQGIVVYNSYLTEAKVIELLEAQ